MKTLAILIRRNILAPLGALPGTLLGYSNGGRLLWVFVVPPAILLFVLLLEVVVSKVMRKPLV